MGWNDNLPQDGNNLGHDSVSRNFKLRDNNIRQRGDYGQVGHLNTISDQLKEVANNNEFVASFLAMAMEGLSKLRKLLKK